jgi:cbb3-type cytochrome oxidase subunit 3
LDYLRKFGVAALAVMLVLYVAGSLRLVLGIFRGQAAGQPLWLILGGLYIRLMIMIFLCFVIFALGRGNQSQK